jgi:hypothetical protein
MVIPCHIVTLKTDIILVLTSVANESDTCWMPGKQQFYIYIMVRTSWWDDGHFVLDKLSWIFMVLAHWNNNPQVDMSLYLDTLSWFWSNVSLLLHFNIVILVEKK